MTKQELKALCVTAGDQIEAMLEELQSRGFSLEHSVHLVHGMLSSSTVYTPFAAIAQSGKTLH